jgi:hypothetical protein
MVEHLAKEAGTGTRASKRPIAALDNAARTDVEVNQASIAEPATGELFDLVALHVLRKVAARSTDVVPVITQHYHLACYGQGRSLQPQLEFPSTSIDSCGMYCHGRF